MANKFQASRGNFRHRFLPNTTIQIAAMDDVKEAFGKVQFDKEDFRRPIPYSILYVQWEANKVTTPIACKTIVDGNEVARSTASLRAQNSPHLAVVQGVGPERQPDLLRHRGRDLSDGGRAKSFTSCPGRFCYTFHAP